MNLNIYTVYDSATQSYWPPMYAVADGQIMRTFGKWATSADHQIAQSPKDYSLFRLGVFDDQTAKFTPGIKTCMATALEAIAASRTIDTEQMDLLSDQLKKAN